MTIADLLTNFFDLRNDKVVDVVVTVCAAHLKQKVAQNLQTLLGALHFGVKLHCIKLLSGVFHCGNGAIRRVSNRHKTLGDFRNIVGVAHKRYGVFFHAVKQHAVCVHHGVDCAVLAYRAGTDFAAEGVTHKLHAVANAKHGDTKFKQLLGAMRRAFVVYAVRTARQYDTDRSNLLDFFHGSVAGQYLGVHVALAHTSGNKLLVLSAEVEDKHRLLFFHKPSKFTLQ